MPELSELTLDQWLQLANTAVLAITAVIVAWYTWETRRLRQEAQDQTKTLTDQLDQLRQEVEIQRSQLEIKRERRAEEEELRIAEHDPILEYHTGGSTGRRYILSFFNAGSTIRDIDVIQPNEMEGVQLSIDKNEELKNGEKATITFTSEKERTRWSSVAKSPFTLRYTNIHGEQREKVFKFDGGKHIESL